MYALSWKLLITGLLLKYFATLLKRLYLKKIAAKCSIFLHQLYFSLWEGQGHFLEIRIKFHLGRAKGRGKRGYWWRSPNELFWVFCAKFPLLHKIQTSSHKLFIRQTSKHHHCNWYAQKLVKNNFVCLCLRNNYGFQIGNAMEKLTLF